MKIYLWHVDETEKRRLFTQLLGKYIRGEWNDEFLLLLIAYRRCDPASEKFEVFYARYALAQGNVQLALAMGQEAERKRRVSPVVWELLAECCERLGMSYEAAIYRAYLRVHCRQPLQISIPEDEVPRYVDLLTCAARIGGYAPYIARAQLTENGVVWKHGVYAGEWIPHIRPETYPYWVGVYLEGGSLDNHGWMAARHRMDKDFADHHGADFSFDIWRSSVQTELLLPCAPGERYIVPIAGTEPLQEFDFSAGGQQFFEHGGQYRWLFYRVEQPVTIRSVHPFAAAQPIPLGHSPKRKKLVLNILVDALSWGAEKEFGYEDVPNLMRFFAKGIIFDNHFSAAEYTYPSLASIETGMYLHHNQVFNEMFGQEIDPSCVTISERMKELGYLCVDVMGDGVGIYNGATRGFDRIIVDPEHLLCYEAVERTIRHIEAFGECDQFLFVHVAETHVYSARTDAPPTPIQTSSELEVRMEGSNDKETSVNLPSRPIYIAANRYNIRSADRALGVLFDYLETHFNDDEYIVHLYSDHGVPVYESEPYLTSEKQAGAALMMRGGGIPVRGIVEELTSGVDIYNIAAHNVGFPVGENVDGSLPAALGGQEREYVITNSIYPGKPYELGIRTQTHEFRLSSEHIVSMDGTVDLDGAKMALWRRTLTHESVDDAELLSYFQAIARSFTEGTIDHAGCQWPEIVQE